MALQSGYWDSFWLDKAKEYKFNPLKDIHTFEDLRLFGTFEDEWLRGGPVQRWIPKGYAGKPTYVLKQAVLLGFPKHALSLTIFASITK